MIGEGVVEYCFITDTQTLESNSLTLYLGWGAEASDPDNVNAGFNPFKVYSSAVSRSDYHLWNHAEYTFKITEENFSTAQRSMGRQDLKFDFHLADISMDMTIKDGTLAFYQKLEPSVRSKCHFNASSTESTIVCPEVEILKDTTYVLRMVFALRPLDTTGSAQKSFLWTTRVEYGTAFALTVVYQGERINESFYPKPSFPCESKYISTCISNFGLIQRESNLEPAFMPWIQPYSELKSYVFFRIGRASDIIPGQSGGLKIDLYTQIRPRVIVTNYWFATEDQASLKNPPANQVKNDAVITEYNNFIKWTL